MERLSRPGLPDQVWGLTPGMGEKSRSSKEMETKMVLPRTKAPAYSLRSLSHHAEIHHGAPVRQGRRSWPKGSNQALAGKTMVRDLCKCLHEKE